VLSYLRGRVAEERVATETALAHAAGVSDATPIAALAVALALLAGCDPPVPANADDSPADTDTRPLHLERALPKLPTVKLWVGDQELLAEVARSVAELSTGMMYRTNLAEGEAMLFVFARPHRTAFYMRNTTVPLTAAYIDIEGTILELHDLEPLNETPVPAESDQVQFVLETPRGWFGRHEVRPGAVLRTPYGSLRELDWRTLRPRAIR